MDYDNLRAALAGGVHPAARGGYRRCAVCLPLFERTETQVLFIQKADTEGYHWRNQIALPGGHVSPRDQCVTDTALRELDEELGIHPEEVEVLGGLGHFQTATSQTDLGVVVVRWNGRRTPKFDPREVARVLEIPLATLVEIHTGRGYAGRPSPEIVEELEYRTAGAHIWGVTARILHFFLERIPSPAANQATPLPAVEDRRRG